MTDALPKGKRTLPKVNIDIGTPNVDPTKRIIDLTVAELIEILDARICHFLENDSAKPDEVYMDRTGVAKLLDVSTHTIDKLCRDSGLPFHRVGDAKRFDRDEVRDWLKAQDAT